MSHTVDPRMLHITLKMDLALEGVTGRYSLMDYIKFGL